MNNSRIIFKLIVVAIFATAVTGCQKQVANETYRPIGSWTGSNTGYESWSAPKLSRTPEQPVEHRSFFDDVGDTLFGWLDGNKKKQAAPARQVKRYDPMWTAPKY